MMMEDVSHRQTMPLAAGKKDATLTFDAVRFNSTNMGSLPGYEWSVVPSYGPNIL